MPGKQPGAPDSDIDYLPHALASGRERLHQHNTKEGPIRKESGPLTCLIRLISGSWCKYVHNPIQVFNTGKFDADLTLPDTERDLHIGIQAV